MTSTDSRYVVLLRAINVGGHSVITMIELRRLFESLGFRDVATHIQSGNVLLSTGETDRRRLAERIERGLMDRIGSQAKAFVFSGGELRRAAAGNPFRPKPPGIDDPSQIMFLSAPPAAARRTALMALQGADYRFAVRGSVLYYAYPRSTVGARRTINFEKVLGVAGTARTWKVIDRLIELAESA